MPTLTLVALAIVMVGAGLANVLLQRRVHEAQTWVTNAHAVQSAVAEVRGGLHRARANLRTYLLTSRSDSLVAYRQGQAALPAQVEQLSALVRLNPLQAEQAAVVRLAVTESLAAYDLELSGRKAPGTTLPLWQQVEAATTAIDREAQRVAQSRRGVLDESNALAQAATALTVLTGLVLLVAIGLLTRRLTDAKASTAVALAGAQRAAAQAALSERDAEFRTLADNISQLVWMAGKDGAVYWFNRRFLEFVGGPPERGLGWGWVDLFDPEHLDRVMSGFKAALSSETDWEDTFPLRSASGETRWFLSRAVPVRDDQGQVLRWLGTNTDITELRDIQAKLLDMSRRKDEFLATLSHELRNPLAPILNASQLMGSPGVTPAQLSWCSSVIQRQSQHLARLVDDLLDASRVARGRLELRKQPTDLRSVIAMAVEAVRPGLLERQHRFELELLDPMPAVDADPVRMAQVITNLLSNACKFTDPGGRITLQVGVRNSRAVITVRDDGIGLETGDLDTVFDMFAQVRSTLARSTGGLGLGLALSKGIVELHGGTIEAASEGIGRGAEFVVELPLSAHALGPAHAPEAAPAPAPAGPLAGRRVLLADDNRDAADSMASVLRLLGHEVQTAYDGLEAMAAAAAFKPHVAVLDIGMPGLNGYDVAQRLRERPEHAGLTLIALTGWGQAEDRKRAMAAGFDRHLTKPADPEVLEQLIATLGRPS